MDTMHAEMQKVRYSGNADADPAKGWGAVVRVEGKAAP
jgi:hypothetical protein